MMALAEISITEVSKRLMADWGALDGPGRVGDLAQDRRAYAYERAWVGGARSCRCLAHASASRCAASAAAGLLRHGLLARPALR